MKGTLTMTRREIKRVSILEHVQKGNITLKQASENMELCYRHAKRLKSKFQEYGPEGLMHGNRGRYSQKSISKEKKRKILELFQNVYFDCNDTHFTELILERENIKISRESVRKLLRAAGIKPKRKRRPVKHHSRRPRKKQMGIMVIWDGSPHHWFGDDKPPCCLMSAIDDATGKILAAVFVKAECSSGYLKLLYKIIEKWGIPMSIYHDGHSSLIRFDDNWSLQEQKQGYQFPTHVGRVLEELGIRTILAHSAQAKGRVERPFGVLQDRLIVELRLAGITTPDAANPWLDDYYIDRYNERFSIVSTHKGATFRKIGKRALYYYIAFAYEAVVSNDNCVRLGGLFIDIPRNPINRRSYAKCKVLVKQHIDGKWTVWFQNKKIAFYPQTEFKAPVRSWKHSSARKKDSTKGAKEAFQVYIASKPASPERGHFHFAVEGTY